MKIYFIILVAFTLLHSCKSDNKIKKNDVFTTESTTQKIDLLLPKEEKSDTSFTPVSNSTTCILINVDSIYCYYGVNNTEGDFYSLTGSNNFRSYIREELTKHGSNLYFYLKPGENASYSDIVSLLDEMTINQIKNYKIINLTVKEKIKYNQNKND